MISAEIFTVNRAFTVIHCFDLVLEALDDATITALADDLALDADGMEDFANDIVLKGPGLRRGA